MTLPYSASENSARDYVLDEMVASEYPMPTGEVAEAIRVQLNAYFGFKGTSGLKTNAETGELFVSDYWMRINLSQFVARELRSACEVEIPAAMQLLEAFKSLPAKVGAHIDWETPDGFHATNKYLVSERHRVTYYNENFEQYEKVRIVFRVKVDAIDVIKASNGMSPNFIHSLDANLVRKVAMEFGRESIYIHDQFMCHPSDGDDMFATIKNCFIDLIKANPLQALLSRHGLDDLYEDLMLNTLDLEQVRESEFIFC